MSALFAQTKWLGARLYSSRCSWIVVREVHYGGEAPGPGALPLVLVDRKSPRWSEHEPFYTYST